MKEALRESVCSASLGIGGLWCSCVSHWRRQSRMPILRACVLLLRQNGDGADAATSSRGLTASDFIPFLKTDSSLLGRYSPDDFFDSYEGQPGVDMRAPDLDFDRKKAVYQTGPLRQLDASQFHARREKRQ